MKLSPLRLLRYLRRRFIDAPRGLGHPVPAAAFDAEYRDGTWALLDSADETQRYQRIAALVRRHGSRPRLLDAGCGNGRLLRQFQPGELAAYHGVDFSAAAIAQARAASPDADFVAGDLETWRPASAFDLIVVNEVTGYFRDPAAVLVRLAAALARDGAVIVSLYRWGNALAIWRRIGAHFTTTHEECLAGAGGKVWDIRVLQLRSDHR